MSIRSSAQLRAQSSPPSASSASRLRIVQISDCYPPRVGGIEFQVRDLAQRQGAAGHAVHVLTATAADTGGADPRSRYRRSDVEAPGLVVHRIASRATFGLPFHPWGTPLIRRALRRIEPDVVHVHAGLVAPFAYHGAVAARSLDVPLVVTWHCRIDGFERLFGLGSAMTGWNCEEFVSSAASAEAADRIGAALQRRTSVLPNGFEAQMWQQAAQRRIHRPQPGTLRMVATQRLAPRKRLQSLIRVVGAAHERLGANPDGSPRVRLTIVGDGHLRGALEAQVAAAGLTGVIELVGRVDRSDLPELYRSQEVFVTVAELETFAGAALEARLSGLAVVGRSGTGVGAFVAHGQHGFLADSDQEAVSAIVRLAQDPDLVDRIRAINAVTPPRADWDDVLAMADALYDEALAAGPVTGEARGSR